MSHNQTIATIDYGKLGNHVGTVIYSIIYLLGYAGNAFALLTFSSSKMRQISSSIFLLILSISDTMALLTSVWFFLADAFAIHLQNYSALACRFRTFFAYVFMDLSSWCIAGLALDRLLRTEFPVQSRTICTPRHAAQIISIFFVVLCAINGHYFSAGIGQERGGNRTTAHCLENRDLYPKYYYFYKIIWPKIDMIVFCFLPACIMILCNIRILYILRHRRRQFELHNEPHSSSLPLQRSVNGSFVPIQRRSSHRKSIERQMSLMMFSCVIVFLLTTMPATIYLILLEQVFVNRPNFSHDSPYYVFIFRLLRALMYTHFASNFYLHCLTSRLFRAEFLKVLSFRRLNFRNSLDENNSNMNKMVTNEK